MADITSQAVTATIEPLSPTAVVDNKGETNNSAATPVETQSKEDTQRFAQLARREKMLRVKSQEFAQREAQLKAREELLLKQQQPDVSWKDRIKQDPIGLFAEAGLSYEDIVNNVVNQNPNDLSIRQLQQKIEGVLSKQEEIAKNLEAREKSSMDQALNQMRFDIKNYVAKAPEEFEVLNKSGDDGAEMVLQLIQKQFEEDGHIMDTAEAAKAVEDFLTEKYLDIAKLKKIQSKLTPVEQAQVAEVVANTQPVKKPSGYQVVPNPRVAPSSLSHSMAPSTKAPTSAKERIQRAILAFEGKLTQ